MNSDSNYGVPIHFLWGKHAVYHKQSVLSKLKGNYTYNQVWCLMIATQSTNIVFKLLTVGESDCAICVI